MLPALKRANPFTAAEVSGMDLTYLLLWVLMLLSKPMIFQVGAGLDTVERAL